MCVVIEMEISHRPGGSLLDIDEDFSMTLGRHADGGGGGGGRGGGGVYYQVVTGEASTSRCRMAPAQTRPRRRSGRVTQSLGGRLNASAPRVGQPLESMHRVCTVTGKSGVVRFSVFYLAGLAALVLLAPSVHAWGSMLSLRTGGW